MFKHPFRFHFSCQPFSLALGGMEKQIFRIQIYQTATLSEKKKKKKPSRWSQLQNQRSGDQIFWVTATMKSKPSKLRRYRIPWKGVLPGTASGNTIDFQIFQVCLQRPTPCSLTHSLPRSTRAHTRSPAPYLP